MFHASVRVHIAFAVLLGYVPLDARAEGESRLGSSGEARWAMLPTDRTLRADAGVEPLDLSEPLWDRPSEVGRDEQPLESAESETMDFKKLIRPQIEIFSEWEPESDGLAIDSYDLSAKMPLYPVFGPPPPFLTAGYSFTQIVAPGELDFPERLHDISLGLAWMRRISDRWMARFMLNGAFASDMDNTGSEAWQIRGGGFALFRPNEQWSWAFGALATGRVDLPVIPAIGVVWEPSPKLRIDLMMPNPRVSFLLTENETRQQWGYVGGGISGGTWAYDRASGAGERLSYREFRLVLGWESMPPRPPGVFRAQGTRLMAEIGYVFGREFEFDRFEGGFSPEDALLLRTGIRF